MKTYLHMNPKWLRTAIGIIVLLFTTAVCNVRAEFVIPVDTIGSDTSGIEKLFSDVTVNTDSTNEEFSNVRHKNTFGTIKALTKKIVNHKNDIVFIVVALLIVIVLLYLASAWVFFLFKKTHPLKEDCLNWGMRAFLLLMIIEICVFSNSSWAYLALVALCVLLLDKYIPGLLTDFSKAAAAIQGKPLDLRQASPAEISKKRKAEAVENSPEIAPARSFRDKPSLNETINLQLTDAHLVNQQVADYTAVEQLALKYLKERRYPNLQGLVKVRMNSNERVVLDGLVQQENKNVIIEIKYCRNENAIRRYQLQGLYKAAEFISRRTAKPTEVLLFIVTDNEEIKARLEQIYSQIPEGMNLILEIHTKAEITI